MVLPGRFLDLLVDEFAAVTTNCGNLFWNCVVLAILWVRWLKRNYGLLRVLLRIRTLFGKILSFGSHKKFKDAPLSLIFLD